MSDTTDTSSPSCPGPAERPPRSRAQVFKALLLDKRISAGAFRLWHFFYDHVNDRRGDVRVWPGFRSIIEAMDCRPERVKPWLDELEAAGWVLVIRAEPKPGKKKSGRHSYYDLQDGQGSPLPLRKSVAATTTEKRSGSNHYGKRNNTTTEKRSGPLRISEHEVTSPVGGKRSKKSKSVASSDSFASANAEQESGSDAQKGYPATNVF